jgi:hypothetical protein
LGHLQTKALRSLWASKPGQCLGVLMTCSLVNMNLSNYLNSSIKFYPPRLQGLSPTF